MINSQGALVNDGIRMSPWTAKNPIQMGMNWPINHNHSACSNPDAALGAGNALGNQKKYTEANRMLASKESKNFFIILIIASSFTLIWAL